MAPAMKKITAVVVLKDPLTNPQENGTLGGRDGSSSILKGEPSCPLSPSLQPNGPSTASGKPVDYLARARWLSEQATLSYARDALEELAELEAEGDSDDD